MKNIYVIRHSETDFNRDGRYLGSLDEPLNATGFAQAEKLAMATSGLGIGLIYCSPLKRTLETFLYNLFPVPYA